MDNVIIKAGDITKAKVDAIVNAANSVMLGGGGVDGAIHRAAGPTLLESCQMVAAQNGIRCPVGESRITQAGDLNASYVIHTVGPRYGKDAQPQQLLAAAYSASLRMALEHGCTSIAFPAISCGVYAYPIREAASIAVRQCSSSEFSALKIYFYLFSAEIYQQWLRALDELKRAR